MGIKKTQEIINIFKHILNIYPLTYEYILEQVELFLNTNLSFFIELEHDKFYCNYSSLSKYKVQNIYEKIDKKNINYVYHKNRNNIVGFYILESNDIEKELNTEIKLILNDILCIGLKIIHFSNNKYIFMKHVCFTLSQSVENIVIIVNDLQNTEIEGKTAEKLSKININLSKIMTVLYDTIDYIEITEDKLVLDKNILEINIFLKKTIDILNTMYELKIDLKYVERMPKYMISDNKNLQQIFILLVKRLKLEKMLFDINFNLESKKMLVNIKSKNITNLYRDTIGKLSNIDDIVIKLYPIQFEDVMFLKLCKLLDIQIKYTNNDNDILEIHINNIIFLQEL